MIGNLIAIILSIGVVVCWTWGMESLHQMAEKERQDRIDRERELNRQYWKQYREDPRNWKTHTYEEMRVLVGGDFDP